MGSNPIAARSKTRLMNALAEIMKSKPIDSITVTELCSHAELSRPAFYQNFNRIDEVLARCIREKLRESIDVSELACNNDPMGFARWCVEMASTNREILYMAASQGRVCIAMDSLAETIEEICSIIIQLQDIPDDRARRIRRFVSGGFSMALLDWASSDGSASEDEVAQHLGDLVNSIPLL